MVFSLHQKVLFFCLTAAMALSSVGAEVPNGYSVYAYDTILVGRNASLGGGVVGCQSFVRADANSSILGSIEAVGDIKLINARVEGDATSSDAIVLEPERDPTGRIIPGTEATVGGTITEYANVPQYTIPEKTVSVGSTCITVPENGSTSIAPGNYKTINLGKNSTLTLTHGEYNVNNLVCGKSSTVNLDFSESGGININVKSQFDLKSDVKVQLVRCADASLVEIYFDGQRMKVGSDAIVYGNVTAPNALVTFSNNARLSGKLFANKVSIGSYAEIDGFEAVLTVDSDGDGVPDYVEAISQTGSFNATDKPAVVVEGSYINKTMASPQMVVLSVAHELGYSRDRITITFVKGSLGGDLIPVVDIIPKPAELPDIPDEDGNVRLDGVVGQPRIFSIEGTINTGSSVYMGFPLSDASVSLPREFFRIFHYNGSSWDSVPVDAVVNGIAYAYVTSYSYYAVGVFENLIRVNPDFVNPPVGDYTNVHDGFEFIRSHTGNTERFVVLILGNRTYSVYEELPVRTSIIGGFEVLPPTVRTTTSGTAGGTAIPLTSATGFNSGDVIEIWNAATNESATIQSISGNNLTLTASLTNFFPSGSTVRAKIPGNLELSSDPRKNPTTFIQVSADEPILMITISVSSYPPTQVETYIDGITLRDANFNDDSYYAAMYLSSGRHWQNLYVRNCIFTGNHGTTNGALYLFNVSNVHFQSCVFAENEASGNEWGNFTGSAVNAYQVSGCGVGASFESCVFYANTTAGSNSAPIVNAGNAGSVNSTRYLSFLNCTMYGNTGTCVILAVNNTNKLMPIQNCIFAGNTIGGTEIVTPITYLNDPGTNLTYDPGFVNTTSPTQQTAIIGTDGKWGTHDDGLQLLINSPAARNASTTTPEFDVTGRRRAGVQPAAQTADKGAYERYINILNVGDHNTLGENGGHNYEAYLKQKAESFGYLMDFVGPRDAMEMSSVNSLLQTDPLNPANLGILDVQCGAQCDVSHPGTIEDLKNTFGTFATTTFDCALLMIGSVDAPYITSDAARGIICDNIATFANALANAHPTGKVYVSCIPADKTDSYDEIYVPFNYGTNGLYSKASSFTPAILIGSTTNDINTDNQLSFESGTNNVINLDGYSHIADAWWAALNPNLH